jgi:hypothetical protein
VAQGAGPEFKPQYCKKNPKNQNLNNNNKKTLISSKNSHASRVFTTEFPILTIISREFRTWTQTLTLD